MDILKKIGQSITKADEWYFDSDGGTPKHNRSVKEYFEWIGRSVTAARDAFERLPSRQDISAIELENDLTVLAVIRRTLKDVIKKTGELSTDWEGKQNARALLTSMSSLLGRIEQEMAQLNSLEHTDPATKRRAISEARVAHANVQERYSQLPDIADDNQVISVFGLNGAREQLYEKNIEYHRLGERYASGRRIDPYPVDFEYQYHSWYTPQIGTQTNHDIWYNKYLK